MIFINNDTLSDTFLKCLPVSTVNKKKRPTNWNNQEVKSQMTGVYACLLSHAHVIMLYVIMSYINYY